MIRLLADHDFNERILEGMVRREPAIELLRVRDLGLSAASDPVILDWAARDERVVLTHDRRTMPGFANQRVAAGEQMPGVFLVDKSLPIGAAVDELLLAIHCFEPDECRQVVKYFPL